MSGESEKKARKASAPANLSSLKTHITGHILFRVHAMKIKGTGGIGGIAPLILNIDIRYRPVKSNIRTHIKNTKF
jgi:hypothetical protein